MAVTDGEQVLCKVKRQSRARVTNSDNDILFT